jgi:hypothetical protein
MSRIASFSLVALAFLPGCELIEEMSTTDTASTLSTADTGFVDEGPSGNGGGNNGNNGGNNGGGSNPGTSDDGDAGWTTRNHTCYGDGVDAMWIDDDGWSMFIGCGTNTEGYGLHYTPDRGETWPDVNTDPRGAVGGRVNAITRGSDGLLYVGGEGHIGAQVVSVDTSVSPWSVDEVYDAGSSFSEVQLAGSFAINDDGMAVVEALNGTQISVRWSPTSPWQDAAGWAGGASVQMQDLEVFDNQFYGTGSTMNQAPMVFLPPRNGHVEADGFNLVVVELSDYAQELRNMGIDDDGQLIVGGVDHGLASGVIYVSNDDPRDADDWTEVYLMDFMAGTTWIDGVCRHGDVMAAVGRYSNNNDPIALLSEDGGLTWRDLTTELDSSWTPALYRCEFLDDGDTIAVAGGDGWLGFYER